MKLTHGGWALVGLIALILTMASSSNPTIFIVLAAFVALLLLNVPLAFVSVRGLSIRRDHPTHVREGTEVRVRLFVVNRARSTRILLRFFDTLPGRSTGEPAALPLIEAGERRTVTYTCQANRRGLYTFHACRVESSSPFGLVNARVSVPATSELVVYPIYYELSGATLPFHKSFTGITAAPGARPGEGLSFFGLREYRPGDPIRKIHWPTTVRTRTVMVKEFEEDVHSSVSIFMDTYRHSVATRGEDTNLEVAIRAAASLANHLLVSGHPLSFTCADAASGALRTDKTAGDLTPILDALARVSPGTVPAHDLLAAAEGSTAKMSNWIVILLNPDPTVLERLLHVRSQGIEILLILADGSTAGAPAPEAALMGMLEGAGIVTIRLAIGDDIQGRLMTGLRASTKLRSAY